MGMQMQADADADADADSRSERREARAAVAETWDSLPTQRPKKQRRTQATGETNSRFSDPAKAHAHQVPSAAFPNSGDADHLGGEGGVSTRERLRPQPQPETRRRSVNESEYQQSREGSAKLASLGQMKG